MVKATFFMKNVFFEGTIISHHTFCSSQDIWSSTFVIPLIMWMPLWHNGFVSGLSCGRPGFNSPSVLVFFHMIIFSKKVSFYSCFLPNYCRGLNFNPIPIRVDCFWPQQQKTAWLFHTFVAKLNKIHDFFFFSL